MMDKQSKIRERLIVQALYLVELAASESRKDPEKRSDGVRTIASQLRVLAELGVGELGAEPESVK